MKDSLYEMYLVWFETKFDCLPDTTYCQVSNIAELLSMRREFNGEYPDSELHLHMTKEEIAKEVENLKVLTFEEFKVYHDKIIHGR